MYVVSTKLVYFYTILLNANRRVQHDTNFALNMSIEWSDCKASPEIYHVSHDLYFCIPPSW